MSPGLRAAAIIAWLPIAAVAQTPAGDDEEARWLEDAVALPSSPVSSDLVEIDTGPTSANRYLIDARSVTVGTDRVVRYTLVVRAQGGASSASYEGLRCDTGEFKVFGSIRSDGSWGATHRPVWRTLSGRAAGDPRRVLAMEYLCADGRATPSVGEIVRRLRAGGRFTSDRH